MRQRISAPLSAIAQLRNGRTVTIDGKDVHLPATAADRELAVFLDALCKAIISRAGDGRGIGDRFDDADVGDGGSTEDLVIGRKLILDGGDGKTITLDPAVPVITIREGGFMEAFGAKFGADDDLFRFVGGDSADLDALEKTAAAEYRANVAGQLVEGGSGGAGAINWSNQRLAAVAGETVTVTHSDDGTGTGTTNGNDITVTMSYRYAASGTSTVDNSGAIGADLILTRNYDGGGAVSVATPTATGARGAAFDPGLGLWVWGELIEWSDTYVDTTGAVEDRVFILELDVLDVAGTGVIESRLNIASSEPA